MNLKKTFTPCWYLLVLNYWKFCKMFSYISLRSYSSKDNLYINLLDLEFIRILLSEHFRNISITKARPWLVQPTGYICRYVHLLTDSQLLDSLKNLLFSPTELSSHVQREKYLKISLTFSISFGLGLFGNAISV